MTDAQKQEELIDRTKRTLQHCEDYPWKDWDSGRVKELANELLTIIAALQAKNSECADLRTKLAEMTADRDCFKACWEDSKIALQIVVGRSGYSWDCEYLELYRANVDRAILGRRGQAFLREMAEALDNMPVKRLIAEELINADGEVCAKGAVCKARGLDVSHVDPYDLGNVASLLDIAYCLAAEIAWINDENNKNETPEHRWIRVRKWIAEKITEQQ